MMPFEGDRDFVQGPGLLWNKMRDAAFLVDCIPDGFQQSYDGKDRATCVVRPGFSFVRGTLDIGIQIVDAQEPTLLKVVVAGKGIGSGSVVEILLSFVPHGQNGTRIHWKADITKLTGLLQKVPQGLIRGAAQKIIADVWNSLQQKVA